MDKNRAVQAMIEAQRDLKRAERLMQVAVDEAYFTGASWAEIGKLLGLSKQTAYNRYGKTTNETKEETPAEKATTPTYTEEEEAQGKAALAALKAVDARKTKQEKASKKVNATSPAGFRRQYEIPIPDETAQPGIGKGMGPHTCPACLSSNHKTEHKELAAFTAQCVPTQYDPAKIAYLMWETNR